MNRGRAQQEMQRLRGIVTRAEKGQTTGRNAGFSRDAARARFELSLRALVAVEDAEGVEAAAALSDRLTDLRQRAVAVGLLSAADVLDIETRVTDA